MGCFHSLPGSPFRPRSSGRVARRAPPLTDARRVGDELADLQPPPLLLFPGSLFLLLSFSPPLSLLSSEQTLWRRRRDVTPFTAALEPALPAPPRRFPWRRGFGVVNQKCRLSADRPEGGGGGAFLVVYYSLYV